MKKKLIGLSILLLVLLLGSFSTSYAFEYLITQEDCQTLANTYYASKLPTDAKNRMWSFVNSMYTTYNLDTIIINIQNDDTFIMKGFNSSQVTAMYNAENKDTWNISLSGSYYQASQTFHPAGRWTSAYWDGGSISTNTSGTCTFGSGGQYRTTYLLVSNNLGSLYVGPYQNLNILTLTPSEHFDFTYDDNLSFASLHDSQGYFGEVALVPKGTISIKLGELEQAQFIDYIIKQKMKYNKYTGFFDTYSAETITTWDDEDDIYNVFVNGNDIANIFVLYTAYSNDSDFLPLNYSYFITDNMTIISGDSIELALIFDDDNYYNDYSNSIQNEQDEQAAQDRTDEIINTITDDSQVTGMLNDFGSGDINTFASKFGLPSIPNPFSNFIETIFYGITDVLTLDGDVTLDFGILGTINSSQFTTPTNAVTIFVSSFLTFIFVYYMIELGYSTLMSIREFNLDKSGIYYVEGMHPESGLQADGSWRLL